LKRQLSLPVSMMSQWWVRLNIGRGAVGGIDEDAYRGGIGSQPM
jgi:hypothetical protein